METFIIVIALLTALSGVNIFRLRRMPDEYRDSLNGAKKDWQLAKVPDFVDFLNKALAEKQEQKKIPGVQLSSAPREMDEVLAAADERVVAAAKITLLARFEEVVLAQLKEVPKEGISCFPDFREKLVKLKNAASRWIKHLLSGSFEAALTAEIDLANRAAKDFFDNSQKQNRKLLTERARLIRPVGSLWNAEEQAGEWTNLELRADTPNLSRNHKALKHVEKLCGRKPERWTVGVGTHWFILFQVIRQSGLPRRESFGLFSKAAKDSCTLTLPEVVEARSRAHEILAESRTWPLVGQVSDAFLRATEYNHFTSWTPTSTAKKIRFPLGWSTHHGEISNDKWIGWLFSEVFHKNGDITVTSLKYQSFAPSFGIPPRIDCATGGPLRLNPAPSELSSINQISHLLWTVNFRCFAIEFKRYFGKLVHIELTRLQREHNLANQDDLADYLKKSVPPLKYLEVFGRDSLALLGGKESASG